MESQDQEKSNKNYEFKQMSEVSVYEVNDFLQWFRMSMFQLSVERAKQFQKTSQAKTAELLTSVRNCADCKHYIEQALAEREVTQEVIAEWHRYFQAHQRSEIIKDIEQYESKAQELLSCIYYVYINGDIELRLHNWKQYYNKLLVRYRYQAALWKYEASVAEHDAKEAVETMKEDKLDYTAHCVEIRRLLFMNEVVMNEQRKKNERARHKSVNSAKRSREGLAAASRDASEREARHSKAQPRSALDELGI